MEDTLYVNGAPEHPALLLDASRVVYQGQPMSLNDWAKAVTGWRMGAGEAAGAHAGCLLERERDGVDDRNRPIKTPRIDSPDRYIAWFHHPIDEKRGRFSPYPSPNV